MTIPSPPKPLSDEPNASMIIRSGLRPSRSALTVGENSAAPEETMNRLEVSIRSSRSRSTIGRTIASPATTAIWIFSLSISSRESAAPKCGR